MRPLPAIGSRTVPPGELKFRTAQSTSGGRAASREGVKGMGGVQVAGRTEGQVARRRQCVKGFGGARPGSRSGAQRPPLLRPTSHHGHQRPCSARPPEGLSEVAMAWARNRRRACLHQNRSPSTRTSRSQGSFGAQRRRSVNGWSDGEPRRGPKDPVPAQRPTAT